ncbi:MAG: hypothetical protein Q7T40_01515 [Methylobacter sp.]|nr:hypothetical protein [Methylobacter sp.]
MGSLKARLSALEALVRKVKRFLPVQAFVLDGTDAQAEEIAKLEEQGIKVRLFNVVE